LKAEKRVTWKSLMAVSAIHVALLTMMVIFKETFSTRGGGFLGFRLFREARHALREFTLGSYGLGLPHVLRTIYTSYWSWPAVVLAATITVVTAIYLARLARHSDLTRAPISGFLCTIVGSLAVSGLSYAYFFSFFKVNPGINNRVMIAAAVGLACGGGALAGLICRIIAPRAAAGYIFCGMIAVLCGCGSLIQNSIAGFWIEASREQGSILRDMKQAMTPPHSSYVMIDGFCPWIGPGIVFEIDWDVTGALGLLYGDATLRGQVLRPWMKITDRGIEHRSEFYSSYDSLYFYNVRRKRAQRIASQGAALQYVREQSRDGIAACLADYEAFGNGRRIW
jgi:hypothetical protein